MRKISKIAHTLASAGLIGGLGCYLILIAVSVPEAAEEYLQMRNSVLLVSNWVIVPSLVITLFTGLVSMAVHEPFLDKGWVWIKAGLGLVMFQFVLTSIARHTNEGAELAEKIVAGDASPELLSSAHSSEWNILWLVIAISVANVVLGVWRPRRVI